MIHCPTQSPRIRRLSGLWCVLAMALSLGGGAHAQATLDLKFRPPAITPGAICVSPPTDDETTDFWGNWDGRVLPDRPMRSIRRDVTRLTQIDGVAWYDTTTRAMDLLDQLDPAFVGQTALVMRIAALDAAAKFEDLTQTGLVTALAALGEDLKPPSKLVLSRYLRTGIGIEQDVARADRLLIEAGFSSDPKALLVLAALQLKGEAPTDWVVPPELAVTTAFSTMVGELDPSICDRTSRIATEFRMGRIVTPDPQLAHDWYRFTADMGNGHAAWKVVEYHMRAEGFEKSNDILLRYLEMAAAANLSYAQIELARLLERGALAPQDLNRAYGLLQTASLSGDLRGLSQFALFLGRHEATNPNFRPQRIELLNALIKRNDAPGWAFSQRAEMILEDRGRWAGAPEARGLFEQAVARDNLDGHVHLARLILADSPNLNDIDQAVDLLATVVDKRGGSQPMTMMRAAHVCRSPGAPDRAAAKYWLGQEMAIGSSDSAESARPLLDLQIETDGPRLAELQSFALSGSADGLAMWRRLIEVAPFIDEPIRTFWANYFEETDERLVAQAKLDLTLMGGATARGTILTALRDRHRTSGPAFASFLNQALVKGMYEPTALARMDAQTRTETVSLLINSAALGYGRAMLGLAALTTDPAQHKALFRQFRDVIDADGDYAAQVFAARYSGTPTQYMARAAGIMPCSFQSAMEMLALSEEFGSQADVAKWLDVADVLAVERTSWMISLAKAYVRGGQPETMPRAVALLSEASLRGDTRADTEIFRLIVTPGLSVYNPERAAGMIAQALETRNIDVLSSYLSAHRSAEPVTRTQIEAQLDMESVYRIAAESGDPVAMRIHGLVLREDAVGRDDLAQAMEWLARAANAGDTVAMTEYGEALAFGIGVPADRAEALIWLERAAARANKKAIEITRLVKLSDGTGQ